MRRGNTPAPGGLYAAFRMVLHSSGSHAAPEAELHQSDHCGCAGSRICGANVMQTQPKQAGLGLAQIIDDSSAHQSGSSAAFEVFTAVPAKELIRQRI